VTASFDEGSAVLDGPDGHVTLAFGADAKECALPPGKYRVRTTRIVRESFILSSAGVPVPELEVSDPAKGDKRTMDVAETARLEVGEVVRFVGRAKRHGKQLKLGFMLKGADGRGLTVYEDDKRVPVTYKVLAADGKVLAEGKMTYG
jgi:hypothetical protein